MGMPYALRALGIWLLGVAGLGVLIGCSMDSQMGSRAKGATREAPSPKARETIDLMFSCFDKQEMAHPLGECFHDAQGEPGYATVLDQGRWQDVAEPYSTGATPQSVAHSIPFSLGPLSKIDVATGGSVDRYLVLEFRLASNQTVLERRSVPGGHLRQVFGLTDLSPRTLALLGRPEEAEHATNKQSQRGIRGPQRLPPQRTLEEIQETFDRNKTSFYGMFNRRLRQNPDLRGKIIVSFTILPSGEVARCQLISSELSDPELEKMVVERIQQLRFRPRAVAEFTYPNYPILFLPT